MQGISLANGDWYDKRMVAKQRRTPQTKTERWYRGKNIPMREIRRFALQVAERFQPDKIILFGSYAYGTPHSCTRKCPPSRALFSRPSRCRGGW
jgi:hypothetical protein